MKNFVESGDRITVAMPANVNSGDGVQVGEALFGVAHANYASGEQGVLVTKGVFDLPKATGASWSVGDRIYWDNTAKKCTTTDTGNLEIGIAVQAASQDATIGRVRLGAAGPVATE